MSAPPPVTAPPQSDYGRLFNITLDAPAAPVPRVYYPLSQSDPPEGLELHPLAVSGEAGERVNLAIFADGYTASDRETFLTDARALAADIVSGDSAMAHVADLLNVWGIFAPSASPGIGIDEPLPGAPFGLYRPGRELRAVYVGHPGRAHAACAKFKECDQPVLLGNDGLYGGLGGTFTIITASQRNGPLVLRHELGHSLIPVGEEYEGGFVYSGVNADAVENVHKLKWKRFLSDPEHVRVEDAKVPLQAYPWHDLDEGKYVVRFEGSNRKRDKRRYTSARLRLSLSSIPYASHVRLTLNGVVVDLSPQFAEDWDGVLDRRWVHLPLPDGLPAGKVRVEVALTNEGRRAKAGQGGKMLSSIEIAEYAEDFQAEPGFVGAFPTYDENGDVSLRPTNEDCLMRNVNQPHFCVVCAHGLRASLKRRIARKKGTEAAVGV
ncbi:hypothetical protein CC85DRAFT_244810 [Cutaneotrichosporon oleaginosum]|uniref:IgA peptidase M64 n=1 Tax=Cutaneotrichosporon oleaginosum TaxID=879819 RepID=A0A0J0XPS8_9TREE|nr:uncharacterized protein CC85DRAFT_244810 [Cutaneotrichosporon oleaginosum]KLT43077.1 hypothetical protein CC85DRAFT_244810 [Cutaneotrichosporon oleaginosum]TXT10008.1 hypothetical protein COLE_03942 [Cutaneotrichosporon oleaginosum]